jgi:hypothetical protein
MLLSGSAFNSAMKSHWRGWRGRKTLTNSQTLTCEYLSGIVIIGLLIQLLKPGWWWIKGAAPLAIVSLLVKEVAKHGKEEVNRPA